MKKTLLMVVAMVALVAAPTLAGDGMVSKSTLNSLGLGQMTAMSDSEGMKVRGMSSNSQSSDLVAFAYIFFDVNSNSQFNGNGNSWGRATSEDGGMSVVSSTMADALSGQPLAFTESVTTNGAVFTATLSIFSLNSQSNATGF